MLKPFKIGRKYCNRLVQYLGQVIIYMFVLGNIFQIVYQEVVYEEVVYQEVVWS